MRQNWNDGHITRENGLWDEKVINFSLFLSSWHVAKHGQCLKFNNSTEYKNILTTNNYVRIKELFPTVYCKGVWSLHITSWSSKRQLFHRILFLVISEFRLSRQTIKSQILNLFPGTQSEMWTLCNLLCLVVSFTVSVNGQNESKFRHLKYLFKKLI